MHIAQLIEKPANSFIEVDSLLVQHRLRSTIENHQPLVLALTHLSKTIRDAQLEIKTGLPNLSRDEKDLLKEASQFIASATVILIIAANHEYSFSKSFDVLSSLICAYGSFAAKLCSDELLSGYTKHVSHENDVDLQEAFLAKQSAAELLCHFVGEKLSGEIRVGVGTKYDHQVYKWSAAEFFKELQELGSEIRSIGKTELSKLAHEVLNARIFKKKP